MRTFKLTLAYDGTNFFGWQRQNGTPTIQACVETALCEIEGHIVTVHGAGRTDAGVHALGQVASFRLGHAIEAPSLVRALNAKLPSDIRVIDAEQVADDFHARFDACSKTYRYWLATGPVANPLASRFVWHLRRPIDLTDMQEAGSILCGCHDFAAFQTAADEKVKASTVRTISELTIGTEAVSAWLSQIPSPESECVFVDVVGDGFLRHMVRSIVGTLVDVGWGRRSVENVTTVLASCRRENAGPTAPARGLFLVQVGYP
jgi:tRNA pseudouridine38-40 synthase